MRNAICSGALGLAAMAAPSLVHAQAVETIITPAPGPAVVAQAPVAVPPSGVLLAQPAPAVVATPVETVETVRTVDQSSTPRATRRRVVHHRPADYVARPTTVRAGVVTTPAVAAAPPYNAAYSPAYNELVEGPRYYDVVTPAPGIPPQPAPVVAGQAIVPPAPVVGAAVATPMPTYRYVYEPNRILVIDPYTNIAVQAIPR
jgi:hypothetical protein